MEVGAVKQASNNELILLKKKLNQAKIQIIHKLTRKAKTFVEKKGPEKIKEKLKRKAEAAVNEVLIIKKIKPKDLARFIVTHNGELNSHLNKPNVDQDKACARLLLHKSLQDKYKFIRDRFSSVPIEDLLMSREERQKIKKEAREKQKNKKNGKGDNKVINSEGDWDVEDVDMPVVKRKKVDDDLFNDEDGVSDAQSDEKNDQSNLSEDNSDHSQDEDEEIDDDEDNNDVNDYSSESGVDHVVLKNDAPEDSSGSENEEEKKEVSNVGQFVKATPEKISNKPLVLNPKTSEIKPNLKVTKALKKVENKRKDKSKQDKNKNLNEKLLSRKFKRDVKETPIEETKVVDPFFITSTGENYMSVVEPRQPDEVKDEHMQGNRKIRRAAMFGHVPKIKPRKDVRKNDFEQNNRFNRNNDSFNKNNGFNKFKNSDGNDKRSFTDKRSDFNKNRQEDKPVKEEKLHPSWEAKKKQSGILPFQGKKIVFDES